MQRRQFLALVCSFLLTQPDSLACAKELARLPPSRVVSVHQAQPVVQPISAATASPDGPAFNAKLVQREPLTMKALIANLDEESFIYDLLQSSGLIKFGVEHLKTNFYNLAWQKKVCFRKVVAQDLHANTETRNN